jgi:hypothetical protein
MRSCEICVLCEPCEHCMQIGSNGRRRLNQDEKTMTVCANENFPSVRLGRLMSNNAALPKVRLHLHWRGFFRGKETETFLPSIMMYCKKFIWDNS